MARRHVKFLSRHFRSYRHARRMTRHSRQLAGRRRVRITQHMRRQRHCRVGACRRQPDAQYRRFHAQPRCVMAILMLCDAFLQQLALTPSMPPQVRPLLRLRYLAESYQSQSLLGMSRAGFSSLRYCEQAYIVFPRELFIYVKQSEHDATMLSKYQH